MDDLNNAYDVWATKYDQQENKTRDLGEQVLEEYEDLFEDAVVLECGCGTGNKTQWIAKRCLKVVGVDFSEKMLEVAQAKVEGDHVVLLQQDLNDEWMVENEVVDVIVFNLVLEHIDNIKHVFKEAHRALKDGGGLLLAEYHPDRQAMGKGASYTNDAGEEVNLPCYPHSEDDFAKAAEGVGFEFVELNDWKAEGDDEPRLLSMLFVK
ncbi:class I SAM-dependent methyltransferase [Planctomycetota bacterium]|nr:class I SAM-dependent methyltransferase [Planctomycetota bacterium]